MGASDDGCIVVRVHHTTMTEVSDMSEPDFKTYATTSEASTAEHNGVASEDATKDCYSKFEDHESGITINGDSSKLSEPDSPLLDEDDVMKDTSEWSKASHEASEVPEVPDQPIEPAPRRSTRSRKVPANYETEHIIPVSQEPAKSIAASSRPKRKAAATAQRAFTSKEDLNVVTKTICEPMESEELRSYKGWVELESEPSFFQAMLHEIGAPDLKITELFSTDEGSVDALPKPVYGLIFLFPYEETGEQSAEERHDCPDGLWFANQTTANGCATVALMNIAMNIPDPKYGPELRDFKSQTEPLGYLDRGHALDANDFIRCIHNSVARRTQLLNEDLAWQNKVDEEERKSKRAVRTPKSRGRGKGKGKSSTSTAGKKTSATNKKKDYSFGANHYIAYVPYQGKVWEFDGLEDKPLCLGPYNGNSDDWVMTAIETIQVRMAAGIFSNTFNLLALCATPLQSLEDKLIRSLAAAHKLEQEYKPADGAESSSWPHPSISTLFPPEKLESLNHLSWEMAVNVGPTQSFLDQLTHPDFTQEQATLMMAELIVEQNDIEAELIAEISSHQSAQVEYKSRQKDFTPFVHQLLLALSEKGQQFEETVQGFVEK